MSKFTKTAKKTKLGFTSKPVTNFMGGTSYTLDPVSTLRIVLASSIFGEPSYYEGNRAELQVAAINAALDYDFGKTLDLAVELREEAWMRLNPQVIMVLASVHPKREAWTKKNPGKFQELQEKVARRPDDLTTQVEFYISRNGSKNGMPSVLKRSIAHRLGNFSAFHINKYKGTGIGLIDVARITHATSPVINELMKGTLSVADDNKSSRALKSAGYTWKQIRATVRVSHDDYLYNLRGMLSEAENKEEAESICQAFIDGAKTSKIWPYKYWVAFKTLRAESFPYRDMALEALSKALDVVIFLDRLEGRVDVLVDNSGSARHGEITSAGNTRVYEVGNLSGLVTALAADDGHLFTFGDRLIEVELKKDKSVLDQVAEVNAVGDRVGESTENGIWLYLDMIYRARIHVDTLFIYSDMQAGRGGLYGTNPSDYREFLYQDGYRRNIDVWKLVERYRNSVNPKMNVFCVQIAGYDNSVLPENKYRGANLSGWTGKEVGYARNIIEVWRRNGY